VALLVFGVAAPLTISGALLSIVKNGELNAFWKLLARLTLVTSSVGR